MGTSKRRERAGGGEGGGDRVSQGGKVSIQQKGSLDSALNSKAYINTPLVCSERMYVPALAPLTQSTSIAHSSPPESLDRGFLSQHHLVQQHYVQPPESCFLCSGPRSVSLTHPSNSTHCTGLPLY